MRHNGDPVQPNRVSERNGFLPVALPGNGVEDIRAALAADPGIGIAVDLQAQAIAAAGRTHRFEIAPFPKRCRLEGLDEIAYTLGQIEHVAAFERHYEP